MSKTLGKLIQEGLDSGEIKPLPRKAFGAEDVQGALRFMSAGKHFGKVLVEMENFSVERMQSAGGGLTPCFQTSGTHVITGVTLAKDESVTPVTTRVPVRILIWTSQRDLIGGSADTGVGY